MIIGAGMCPVVPMRAGGVSVGLGCDGAAAQDASDLWGEVRQALLLAHLRDGAASFASRDALSMATAGSAACLGRTDIGAIEVGRRADLACYPLDQMSVSGAVLDPVEAVVRCAVRNAKHTVVEGRVLVEDGTLWLDPGPILRRHDEVARAWAEA
jgi:cytosine/adenosine deaminase-related metal-dependent hydrolase